MLGNPSQMHERWSFVAELYLHARIFIDDKASKNEKKTEIIDIPWDQLEEFVRDTVCDVKNGGVKQQEHTDHQERHDESYYF